MSYIMSAKMLQRYKYNAKEVFRLTQKQKNARNSILKNLSNNHYKVENITCPLCDSNYYQCLSEKDAYGLPVNVVICCDCGLVYNNPRLTEDTLPSFYANEYRELDRVLPNVEDYFELEYEKGKTIFNYIGDNDFLNKITGKLIVDIGCGAGGVLAYFRDQGFEVLGCDFVPKHLNFGINEKGLNLHLGDFVSIQDLVSKQNLHIGLIIYEQVFEHLPNPKKELARVKEVIPKDSLLYIGVPGLKNIDHQYNSDFIRFLQLPHLMHYDLKSLTEMLAFAGFTRLSGDETVKSIFMIGTSLSFSPNKEQYDITIQYLKELETRRLIKLIRILPKETFLKSQYKLKDYITESSLSDEKKKRLIKTFKWIRDLF